MSGKGAGTKEISHEEVAAGSIHANIVRLYVIRARWQVPLVYRLSSPVFVSYKWLAGSSSAW